MSLAQLREDQHTLHTLWEFSMSSRRSFINRALALGAGILSFPIFASAGSTQDRSNVGLSLIQIRTADILLSRRSRS